MGLRSPPDTPFSVPGNRHGLTYDYANDSLRGARILDFDDIDHDTIKNDLELRGMFRFLTKDKLANHR